MKAILLLKSFFKKNILAITILGLILLSFVLFSFNLGKESFSLDEILSINASHSFQSLASTFLQKDRNMWLYYLLLTLWIPLGTSEVSIRLLSVITAVGGVIAIFQLGRNIKDFRFGLIAAILLLTNSFYIQYAQEARSYSLFLLLFILSSNYFIAFLQNPTKKNEYLYLIFTVLSIYTHLFAVLFIAIQLIFYTVYQIRRKSSINLLWKWLIIYVISITPLATTLILSSYSEIQAGTKTVLEWIQKPNIFTLASLYLAFSSTNKYLLVIYSVLIASLVLFNKKKIIEIMFFFSITFLPVLFVFLLSLYVKPLFVPRYFIFALPAFILLITYALSTFKKKYFILITIVIFLLQITSLITYFSTVKKEQWRDAVRFIGNNIHTSENIIVVPTLLNSGYQYYASQEETLTQKTVVHFFENDLQVDTRAEIEQDINNNIESLDLKQGVWIISRKEILPTIRATQKNTLVTKLTKIYNQEPQKYSFHLLTVEHFESLHTKE